MQFNLLSLLLALLLCACAPYAKGPVLSAENVEETFKPLTEFMEISPGMTIADVGAGAGAFTIMMGTQLTDCEIIIQDIDSETLEQENVDKIIQHYSREFGRDLTEINDFKIIYGTPISSNLQEASVDVIYMNAVSHVLDSPDAMMKDLKGKLKPTGKIFIRDGFRGHNGEGDYCSARECAKPLLSIEELHALMESNGFRRYKESDDMDGYPVFGYTIS
jgi:ubiquinone/menaquinone biosynthesis C-methylase UbiE